VLSEAERVCAIRGQVCGEIGTETSTQLDYKPASLFVIDHIVHKYACPCRGKGRRQAPVQPELPAPLDQEIAVPQPLESSATSAQEPAVSLPRESVALPGQESAGTPESGSQPEASASEPAQAREQTTAAVELPSSGQSGAAEPLTLTLTLPLAPPRQPLLKAGAVIAATKPAMPIAKGLPGAGLLAHLIVSKYTDHLPLNRLQHIYDRSWRCQS
jgi:transposase